MRRRICWQTLFAASCSSLHQRVRPTSGTLTFRCWIYSWCALDGPSDACAKLRIARRQVLTSYRAESSESLLTSWPPWSLKLHGDVSTTDSGRDVGDIIGFFRHARKTLKWDPKNYHGIHLTSILSKAVERLIGTIVVTFLDRSQAFGVNQLAVRPKRSCRDLTTLLMCTWILGIRDMKNIGVFLSDISGAFDRVDSEILLAKCRRAGLSQKALNFFRAFFAPRRAQVILPGGRSKEFTFDNQVYQGTVLGPPMRKYCFC